MTCSHNTRFPTLRRLAGLGLTGLALSVAAGCSERRSLRNAEPLEQPAAAPQAASWTTLNTQAAWLRLPEGRSRSSSVAERRVEQGLAQDIGLGDSGQQRNHLLLGLHYGKPTPGLGPARPTETGIRSELVAAFPGRHMRIVTQPRHNAFGPYGLAVASGPGAQRCIYAWQWLDAGERQVREQIGASVSWRARICRNGVTLDQLAGDLDQIAIGPPAIDARLEAASARPRPRPLRPQAAPEVAIARPALARYQAAPILAPGGMRYLAPVHDIASPRAAEATAERRNVGLDTSLPPEAYRGPTARTGHSAWPVLAEAAPRVIVPAPH